MRAARMAVAAASVVLGCGCAEESSEPDRIPVQPEGGSLVGTIGEVHLQPGPAPTRLREVSNPYQGDVRSVREGERLYVAYNCGACHGNRGGGGMGPPLRDTAWIYGGDAVSIYRSIMEGRPEGMPTWQGVLPDVQAWKIVAFIQAMGTDLESPPRLRPPANRTPPAADGTGAADVGESRSSDGEGHSGGGSRTG